MTDPIPHKPDPSTAPAPPWETPGWLETTTAWVDAAVRRHGLHRTGALELHSRRPWSVVYRVPVGGPVAFPDARPPAMLFCKAASPPLAYEAGLTWTLAQLRPEWLPRLLAVDAHGGRLLMEHGGERLRACLRTGADIRHWEALLPRYAQLQRDVAARADALVELGTPDRRLLHLPRLYDELLAMPAALCCDLPGGLTDDEVAHLYGAAPLVRQLCRALAGYPLPETLDHGDFHDGNIFVDAEPTGALSDATYRFFDWGDSSITHPFFSLRTAFVSIENRFGMAPASPWYAKLRDAYLAPWSIYAPAADLTDAFALAQRLAPLPAALRWWAALTTLQRPERSDYAHAVPSLLREFLEMNAGMLGSR